MIDLVLAADDALHVRDELTKGHVEGCAILYASQTTRSDGTLRLLVREIQYPSSDDYTRRGRLEAELSPHFVARISKLARREKQALVFVHSHPGDEPPHFSFIDDRGEERLAAFLAHRLPDQAHAALVVSAGGMRARRLGTSDEVRVIALGRNREVLFDPARSTADAPEIFDRQVRAFGAAGQQAIQRLRVAIVGLGGTGSVVAQQLVHLGVRDFLLIDPDVLDTTNLNRVVNATAADVGKPKVNIAANYIRSAAADSRVKPIQGDIIRASIAQELFNADFIFGCTDSHGSRAILQQVAYQYMIPCIDMGMTIVAEKGVVTYVYGRVQLLSPGQACFACDGLLSADQVRRDMMTAFERQADPYIQGQQEPAPSVISLNSTVASTAVTMFLSVVTGIPMHGRHLLYNATRSTLRAVQAQPKSNCYICSRHGSFARGDAWPLLGRHD